MAHRLAVATMLATFALILFGGLVTNTGAALAVPDWPTTFGHNMFFYPWSQMVGGIFYEHSHRLLGAVVGVLTLVLAASLWPAGSRLRALGVLAVVAVCVQGLLGGLRVVLLEETLAIVHGCLAQAFFALIASHGLSHVAARAEWPRAGSTAARARWPRGPPCWSICRSCWARFLTHAGWLDLHLVGAGAVFVLVPIVTARLRRSGDPVGVPLAAVLLALLGVQLLLGVGSYLSRFSAIWIPGGQLAMLAMPVAHRLVGSLILATTVVLAVRAASVRAVAAAPVGPRLAAGVLELTWRSRPRPSWSPWPEIGAGCSSTCSP